MPGWMLSPSAPGIVKSEFASMSAGRCVGWCVGCALASGVGWFVVAYALAGVLPREWYLTSVAEEMFASCAARWSASRIPPSSSTSPASSACCPVKMRPSVRLLMFAVSSPRSERASMTFCLNAL